MADLIYSRTGELEEATSKLKTVEDIQEQANYIRDEILPKMSAVRVVADEAETMTDSKFWPFPTLVTYSLAFAKSRAETNADFKCGISYNPQNIHSAALKRHCFNNFR